MKLAAAPSGPLLEVENLEAGYGPINVLHRLSLTVNRGEIVAMIGANGAGKSTTLNTLSGVVRPRAGRILFNGRDLVAERIPAHNIVKLGLAQSPEGRKIFSRLTVLENLEMGAFTRSDKDGVRADVEKAFVMFPILRERKHQAGGLLSGGQQQMLAIGRALMANPDLLILDEPSEGLAPVVVDELGEALDRLATREGTALLLIEQHLGLIRRAARQFHAMAKGRIVASGPVAGLDEAVLHEHLGV